MLIEEKRDEPGIRTEYTPQKFPTGDYGFKIISLNSHKTLGTQTI
jgi:hypothetical protein